MVSISRNCWSVFKVAVWFYILTGKVWECSGSSISSSVLDMVFLLSLAILPGVQWDSLWFFNLHFLILNSVEHILMNWVVISSLEKCLFSLFLPIFIVVIFVWLLSEFFIYSTYKSVIRYNRQISGKYFSSVACVFTYLQ